MTEQGPSTRPEPERRPRERMEVRPPSRESLRRRRITATIAAAVVALAVALLVIFLLNRGEPEPEVLEPVPGETVTAPVPTATVEPVERDTSTAFLAALPSMVLQWAVAEQTVAEDVRGLGALEAVTLTYTDGTEDLTVVAAQWRTPEAATAYVAGLGITGEPERTEEVVAGGTAVGTMTAYADEAEERVVWNNGRTTFVVVAPPGAATPFYDAFGM